MAPHIPTHSQIIIHSAPYTSIWHCQVKGVGREAINQIDNIADLPWAQVPSFAWDIGSADYWKQLHHWFGHLGSHPHLVEVEVDGEVSPVSPPLLSRPSSHLARGRPHIPDLMKQTIQQSRIFRIINKKIRKIRIKIYKSREIWNSWNNNKQMRKWGWDFCFK